MIMLDHKIKEALELFRGGAVLKDGEQYYVLMTLKEFKRLRREGIEGLTKQELIDKINNDIAAWKTSQEEEKLNDIDLEDVGKREIEMTDEVRYEKA